MGKSYDLPDANELRSSLIDLTNAALLEAGIPRNLFYLQEPGSGYSAEWDTLREKGLIVAYIEYNASPMRFDQALAIAEELLRAKRAGFLIDVVQHRVSRCSEPNCGDDDHYDRPVDRLRLRAADSARTALFGYADEGAGDDYDPATLGYWLGEQLTEWGIAKW